MSHLLKVGAQTRADFLRPVGLYRTQARNRLGTVREDEVTEWGSGVFVEAESRWRPWFRTVVGLRGDVYVFDVDGEHRGELRAPNRRDREPQGVAGLHPVPAARAVPQRRSRLPQQRRPGHHHHRGSGDRRAGGAGGPAGALPRRGDRRARHARSRAGARPSRSGRSASTASCSSWATPGSPSRRPRAVAAASPWPTSIARCPSSRSTSTSRWRGPASPACAPGEDRIPGASGERGCRRRHLELGRPRVPSAPSGCATSGPIR